jgi:sugar phosphate isomerase/epimerase
MDLDEKDRRELVHAARDAGVEWCAIASYNDFSSPIEEHRENELLMVREQIRLAAELGAPLVRVFAAWAGVSRRDGKITYDLTRFDTPAGRQYYDRYPGVTALERWGFVRDTLAEACRMAEEHGVVLALQNHAPIVHGHEEVLELIDEIGSPALKVSLDFPIMRDKSDASVARAVREVGELTVHSHYGGEYDDSPDGPDGVPVQRRVGRGPAPASYATFLRELKRQGFDGYLCYELCHPCVIGHRHFGLDEARAQVRRAATFMRHAIETA